MLLYHKKRIGCLNLVISLSALASNRLEQTFGLWFVDTARFISIVVKIARQTDGRTGDAITSPYGTHDIPDPVARVLPPWRK